MWIASAGDYTSRLKHQEKRYALDELVEDDFIEGCKPPSDYDTASEAEGPDGPVGPKRRVRMRIRRKRHPSEDAVPEKIMLQIIHISMRVVRVMCLCPEHHPNSQTR